MIDPSRFLTRFLLGVFSSNPGLPRYSGDVPVLFLKEICLLMFTFPTLKALAMPLTQITHLAIISYFSLALSVSYSLLVY